MWLRKGNIQPRSEALYVMLQDCNIFHNNVNEKCHHCKTKCKSVDHLATQCDRMVYYDYKQET